MWPTVMFARSHKSLALIHHYQCLAKGVAGPRYPTCFIPIRTWDQKPSRMMSIEPRPPPPEVEPSPSTTNKLFVIASSKSAPNLTGEGSSVVNHLPPKPRLDRTNGDQFKAPAWLKDQNWQQLASQGKDRLVAMVGTIFARETVDRIRSGLMTAWEMSVRTVNSVVYWCRVFMDSREYFYLRYYTLLVLENAVHYARLGFVAVMRRMRTVSKE